MIMDNILISNVPDELAWSAWGLTLFKLLVRQARRNAGPIRHVASAIIYVCYPPVYIPRPKSGR